MINITNYQSPIGNILLASKENQLVGLWIEGQKNALSNLQSEEEIKQCENEILMKTKNWLDQYFRGERPLIEQLDFNPSGTDFRKEVWKILCEIPYGEVTSYKRIAMILAKKRGLKHMSAQAVGNAVGHNPISIIIPCHRVIGSDGNITGYAGGIDKKIYLLNHEKVDTKKFYVPKK